MKYYLSILLIFLFSCTSKPSVNTNVDDYAFDSTKRVFVNPGTSSQSKTNWRTATIEDSIAMDKATGVIGICRTGDIIMQGDSIRPKDTTHVYLKFDK